MRDRWSGPTPGVLERCDLAVYRHAVWRLWQTYDFARQLLAELPEDGWRARVVGDALRRASKRIDDRDVASTAPEVTAILEAALRQRPAGTATRCFAVGHAHIDTAWLWPIRETRRKCLRSFANVLELMEREPDFRFLCSQAQQYAWVEADAPGLFARIADRVREGRWEAAGGMWVEADCNIPSGESLVRQIIYGVRFWQERFGAHAPQRILYLPDTFGFPASLPQIMALTGLDTFVTNKLAWNQTNEFPHVSFRWRGIDGTEVLAHCTPGHDYNAANTPAELRRGEMNAARKDAAQTGVWLQPFGYGDGGGGPTEAMVRRARLARCCEGLPRVTLARAAEFRAALHHRRAALASQGTDLPVWDGELYLELHRGTYTTQARLKRANRRAENGMRMAEWLVSCAPGPSDLPPPDALRARLVEAWKLVLLNQFHDILPGSSIGAVNEDAARQHERVREVYETVTTEATNAWAALADTVDLARPMIVFNPGSAPRSGVVACQGELHVVKDVPALGVCVIDRSEERSLKNVRAEGEKLANGIIEATIDRAGRISGLRRVADSRDARRQPAEGGSGPLNQLILYEDRPRSWEAWDIDAEYEEKPCPVDGPAEKWRVAETGPQRGVIEVARPLGEGSRIRQRFVLEAGSPRLDVETHVDWHERRRVLRALFPVDVRARRATHEIQFGTIERPTHRNTTWEQAMYEVCAHTWMDLSEPGFGVALLNDGKYGHSCDGNVMGLTLLRSSKFPDPEADMGAHEFTYSLMLHAGNWRAAGVDREAHALNAPLRALPLAPGRAGTLPRRWAPFEIGGEGSAGVVVSAVKRAEADDRLIVRLVETHGGRAELV
ncbi:MAG: alpha-mannosidase, partial [Planctomycetota bacterium]